MRGRDGEAPVQPVPTARRPARALRRLPFAGDRRFFLNVALGAGVGPTAVALCSRYVFGAASGLGPPITLTACAGYAAVLTAAVIASQAFSRKPGNG